MTPLDTKFPCHKSRWSQFLTRAEGVKPTLFCKNSESLGAALQIFIFDNKGSGSQQLTSGKTAERCLSENKTAQGVNGPLQSAV